MTDDNQKTEPQVDYREELRDEVFDDFEHFRDELLAGRDRGDMHFTAVAGIYQTAAMLTLAVALRDSTGPMSQLFDIGDRLHDLVQATEGTSITSAMVPKKEGN